MANKYFLAANSADGFVSFFDKCFDAEEQWRAYIIKGGPGTGKSSLMKRAAARAEEKDIPYELFPCSSDPDSLDAVIFPTIKTVIMDGTAPHTVDPKFPAVCEEIINMGEFWVRDRIIDNHYEVLSLTKKNSAFHKSAKVYIKAMGDVARSHFSYALAGADVEKCVNFAVKIAQKNIPKKVGEGKRWVRFLGGITPKGAIYYTDTINSFNKKILIADSFGAVTSIILTTLADIAVAHGYEIFVIKNALLPNDCLDALLIPELSLCIAREYESVKFDSNARRIHYGRFTDKTVLDKNKQKILFGKKIINRLLPLAIENLKKAKHTHDKLEKYYIDAMDFDKMNLFVDNFIDNLFK